jgi:glycosyltransferase involved in cell wall biosynthesis
MDNRGREKLVFTGRLPDISRILLASDVFFLSSLREGLPNVVLEAIDAGCAIVSTKCHGILDILGGDKELLELSLLESRDPAEAAGKISALLENPEKRRRAAELARIRLDEFAPKNASKAYAELLENCLADRVK